MDLDISKFQNVKTNTYDDIHEITRLELIERLERDFPIEKFQFKGMTTGYKNISAVMEKVSEWLGLKLCNEQFMFLVVENSRLLCEAGAGSGKTTISQLRLLKEKIFRGTHGLNILAIAYNKPAAEDMLERHQQLVRNLRSITQGKIPEFNVTEGLEAKTFHSFALAWVSEYKELIDIKLPDGQNSESGIMMDGLGGTLMGNLLKRVLKENGITEDAHPSVSKTLYAMFCYVRETMLSPTEFQETPHWKDIFFPKIHKDDNESKLIIIAKCFIEMQNRMDNGKAKTDFSNILVKFLEILKKYPHAKERIRSFYKVVLVDEYQDMNPIMIEILKHIIDDDTKLTCIGDGDQSIYAFRGSNPLNCLMFPEHFNCGSDKEELKPKVVSMSTNRRCANNIVTVAKQVINTNNIRYDKTILATREGGNVRSKDIQSGRPTYEYIVEEMKDKTKPQMYETCVAYRNNESGYLLSMLLLEANIPFRINVNSRPYSDLLTKSLRKVMNMLFASRQKPAIKEALYRVTPLHKYQVLKLIEEQDGSPFFWNYELGEFENMQGLDRAINILSRARTKMKEGQNMSQYFPEVWELFKIYFWEFVKKSNVIPEELEEEIVKQFSGEYTWEDLKFKLDNIEKTLEDFHARGQGPILSTFHSLKGLEFDSVYIVDLEDDIFPAISKIESRDDLTENQKLMEIEENTRLFYVALTRARNELTMCWDVMSPSRYKALAIPKKEFTQQELVDYVSGIKKKEEPKPIEVEEPKPIVVEEPKPIVEETTDVMEFDLGLEEVTGKTYIMTEENPLTAKEEVEQQDISEFDLGLDFDLPKPLTEIPVEQTTLAVNDVEFVKPKEETLKPKIIQTKITAPKFQAGGNRMSKLLGASRK